MKKLLLALVALFFASRLFAVTPVPFTEAVSFSFRINGSGGGMLTVYDESPGAPSMGCRTSGTITESDIGLAFLRPGKKYDFNFSASGPSEFWLSFITPKGYVLLINNAPTSLIYQSTGGGGYSYNYILELRPAANYQAAPFGSFSGLDIGKSVTWEIGLGSLRNGRSAGRIIFKEYDLTNSPANRARLYYSAPANNGEITVTKDSGTQTLNQVLVPQGRVDIVDEAGGGYWLKFYTGSPATLWKTVRVELPSSTTFKITDTEGSVSQVSLLTFTAGAAAYGNGGSVTSSGGYNIHTFTSSGTFTATGNLAAEVLLVAGGGGGGNAVVGVMNGGGGGAGGVLNRFRPVASDTYTVTVGAGGASNTNGGNSSFAYLTATGGGHGASGGASPGASGGSGGGEGTAQGAGPGWGIIGQGSNGSNGGGAPNYAGGGGGGAGAGGSGANGSPGVSLSISGSAVTYAGGGGGASNAAAGGTGGSGGGGTGGGATTPSGGDGAPNTGSGGGASHIGSAGSGGSGIVIIKYPTNPGGVTSGNYTWTLQEGDGSTWLKTTTHVSTTYSGYRDDLVKVRTGGTTGAVVSETNFRYKDFGWGEEIKEVTAGPGTANLTTTYDYYTAVGFPISNLGNYRQLKSVATPDANWTAFQYWDDWNRRGQVQYEFHPYLNTPANVSFNPASGRVVYTDYGTDWTGRYTRPIASQELVNNVPTGQTIWSSGDNTGTGLPRAYSTISSFREALQSQTSYTESYRGDAGPDQAFRPYVAWGPDLAQTSFSDGYGTYYPGTGGFTYSSSGGSYFREFRVRGSTSLTGATPVSGWSGQSFASINLLPNQSTLDATIRDNAGNVIRTENWIYTGGTAFSLVSYENFTYDAAGRLTQRSASNGAVTTKTYAAGRLTSVIDATGTETQFTYDLIGRVLQTIKKGGVGAQVDITTTNTLDGVGHMTQAQTTGGSLTVTNTAQYDYAGRPMQQVQYSGSSNALTTSYSYAYGGRMVTTTLPGGSTRTTENYFDGQLYQVTGSAEVSQTWTYSIQGSTGYKVSQSIFGGIAAAYTNTYKDWLGRTVQEWKPGWNGTDVQKVWSYNANGQLYKFTQPGMADTLYKYDNLGVKIIEGLDINANGTLDPGSNDRINQLSWQILSNDSGASWWRQTLNYVYATAGNPAATLVSQDYYRLKGFTGNLREEHDTNDIYGNTTYETTYVNPATKTVTANRYVPGSTVTAVKTYTNGLLTSATDNVSVTMNYGYDSLGRLTTSVDPRTGTTTTAYKSGTNLVDWVKDPANVTQASYAYDSAGRVTSLTDGLGKVAKYEYNLRNQKIHEWGDNTNPVEYAYDTVGRQVSMTTYAQSTATFASALPWPTSPAPSNPQVTTWTFQPATGLLSAKTDAANHAVSYTYTQAGQTATRTSVRSASQTITTSYAYSAATGELTGIGYSDNTTPLSFTYNRLGKMDSATDFTLTRSFVYNLGGTLELQREDLPAFFGSRRLTYEYETSGTPGRLLRTNLGTTSNPAAYQYQDYAYQADGRLNQMNANAAGYGSTLITIGYQGNSHLQNVTNYASGAFVDTRTFDLKHDWVATRSATGSGSATPQAMFDYTFDNLGRITTTTKTGALFADYSSAATGIKNTYGYNDRSEVTADDTIVISTGSAVAGRSDAFAYDLLSNRTSTSHNTYGATYTVNNLNQYTQRTVPGIFDVAGTAAALATVTVNGTNSGVQRNHKYFFKGQPYSNSSTEVNTTVSVSDGTTPTTLPVYVAGTPQLLTYDFDGNLTADGHWTYQYDAENRLVWVQASSAAVGVGYPNIAFRLFYDYLGRRVARLKYTWTWTGTWTWTFSNQQNYIYRDWNLIAEVDAVTGNITKNFFWGLDLSGTTQGAGGVGGLIMIQDGNNTFWPAYDAMGNVHALITKSAATINGISYAAGNIVAAYEYDAFGNTLRESGGYASSNPIRYSTKYTDLETSLVYYGQRYYSPSLGRFINRDPIEEQGGINLYSFVANNGVNRWDYLGFHTQSGWDPHLWYIDGSPDSSWEAFGGSWRDSGGNIYQWRNTYIPTGTDQDNYSYQDMGDYGMGPSSFVDSYSNPSSYIDSLDNEVAGMVAVSKQLYDAIDLADANARAARNAGSLASNSRAISGAAPESVASGRITVPYSGVSGKAVLGGQVSYFDGNLDPSSAAVIIQQTKDAVAFLRANSSLFETAYQERISRPFGLTIVPLSGTSGGTVNSAGNLVFGVLGSVRDNGSMIYPAYNIAHEFGHIYQLYDTKHPDWNMNSANMTAAQRRIAPNGAEYYAYNFAQQVSNQVRQNTGVNIGSAAYYYDVGTTNQNIGIMPSPRN